jgi:4'-phosphopantetheinyl transferase
LSTDIHVTYWLTGGLTEQGVAATLEQLSPQERDRHARFVFARDRRDFAAAHALLRQALSAREHLPTPEWTFVVGRHGKPQLAQHLADRTHLSFNLAHTDGLVACVVTHDADVGIDVESLNRPADVLELAQRYFSPTEVAQLKRYPETEQRTQFIEIWTLKEAYVKAIGDGLLYQLKDFAFVFDGPTSLRFESADGDQAAAWKFALLRPSDQHRLAVAVRNETEHDHALIVRRHDGEKHSTAVMGELLRASTGWLGSQR